MELWSIQAEFWSCLLVIIAPKVLRGLPTLQASAWHLLPQMGKRSLADVFYFNFTFLNAKKIPAYCQLMVGGLILIIRTGRAFKIPLNSFKVPLLRVCVQSASGGLGLVWGSNIFFTPACVFYIIFHGRYINIWDIFGSRLGEKCHSQPSVLWD